MKRRVAISIVAVFVTVVFGCSKPEVTVAPERMSCIPDGIPTTDYPWSSDPRKFSFVILGDKTGGGLENWPIFDRAVEEISLLNPDFVIMVGDQIQGNTRDTTVIREQWEEFWEHANSLRAPFFIVAGNHDVGYPEMYDWWKREYGATYYSFDHKGCHFLILSTEETPRGLGEEQMQWAVNDLLQSKHARHTFVFMHKPVWIPGYSPDFLSEFERLEAVLQDRNYTVFAGHKHGLEFDTRNGRRIFLHGATGAGITPREAREFGVFHHYSHISVDADSVHIAIIEPGNILPSDISTRPFREAVRGLLSTLPHSPEGIGTPTVRTGVTTSVTNDLPDTVVVKVDYVGGAWRVTNGEATRRVVVPPNDRASITATFSVDEADLLDLPNLRLLATYRGKELLSSDRPVTLFPDEELRAVPDWNVVGPWPVGEFTPALLPDYEAAAPRMFSALGPERDASLDATYSANGTSLQWQAVGVSGDNTIVNLDTVFEYPTPINSIAYGTAAVWSPDNRIAYALLRADDYIQLTLNGELFEGGRIFRTRPTDALIALPLRAGWNTLMTKTLNITGGWSFRVQFADPNEELRFAPVVPE